MSQIEATSSITSASSELYSNFLHLSVTMIFQIKALPPDMHAGRLSLSKEK